MSFENIGLILRTSISQNTCCLHVPENMQICYKKYANVKKCVNNKKNANIKKYTNAKKYTNGKF